MIIYAIVLVEGLINTRAFQIVPWMNTVGGCLHVLLFVIFATVFLVAAPKRNTSFIFMDRTASLGWDNDFVSWQIGMLTATSGFVGRH